MDYKWMKEVLSILAHEDGTYDLKSGQPVEFKEGFQVSFETKDDTYTLQQYNDLVARLKSAFSGVFLGVYNGVPEYSVHVDDFEKAVKLGVLFKQYSIWDWKQQKEVVLWHGKEEQE